MITKEEIESMQSLSYEEMKSLLWEAHRIDAIPQKEYESMMAKVDNLEFAERRPEESFAISLLQTQFYLNQKKLNDLADKLERRDGGRKTYTLGVLDKIKKRGSIPDDVISHVKNGDTLCLSPATNDNQENRYGHLWHNMSYKETLDFVRTHSSFFSLVPSSSYKWKIYKGSEEV